MIALKLHWDQNLFPSVEAIGQHGSSKNWTIKFNSSSAYQISLTQSIQIGDKTYNIVDPECLNRKPREIEEKVFKMTVYFRIHWLTLGFTKKQFLSI